MDIEFPSDGEYSDIALDLGLRCPQGGCDDWDRYAYLGLVNDAGTDTESVTELVRFVTPYRVEGAWSVDLTPLRPLLRGQKRVRVFIDTWVGPGHANGAGWLVDAALTMTGGVPSPLPIAVIPVWNERTVLIGDPANPVEAQVAPRTVALPPDATGLTVRSFITGHGQGNLENCAEFCQKNHGFLLGAMATQRTVWRDDCGDNPVQPQYGTWQLSRAGWCPGAVVDAWQEDVGGAIDGTGEVTVSYAVSPYENSCRPDSPMCSGCTLGTGCEYDGGNHTPPSIRLSAVLIAWR